jgi:hypothetical protein
MEQRKKAGTKTIRLIAVEIAATKIFLEQHKQR